MKWKVKLSTRCEKELEKLIKEKNLSYADIDVIKDWTKEVIKNGPYGLSEYKEFNFRPHPLHGNWEGHHSSSFSFKGRIIYKIKDKVVTIEVVRITNEHDYSK